MKIGFVQTTPVFGKVNANVEAAADLVRRHPADLLVLPEFFNTGYLFTSADEVRSMAEPVPGGPTTQFLKTLAAETGTILVAGLPESDAGKFFNTSVMVTPGGTVHTYRKTHLFDREKLFFAPGNTGFQVIDTGTVRVGMMICFDWFFPESARSLALAGAQIIAHPANLVLPHCPAAMITRCLENRLFAVTANRAGCEERGGHRLQYIGNSRIIGPNGVVLAESREESMRCRVVDIDPTRADNKRINSRNDLLEDRRTTLYRFRAD